MLEKDSLREWGRAEENHFFAKRDRELIEKLKQQKQKNRNRRSKRWAERRSSRYARTSPGG